MGNKKMIRTQRRVLAVALAIMMAVPTSSMTAYAAAADDVQIVYDAEAADVDIQTLQAENQEDADAVIDVDLNVAEDNTVPENENPEIEEESDSEIDTDMNEEDDADADIIESETTVEEIAEAVVEDEETEETENLGEGTPYNLYISGERVTSANANSSEAWSYDNDTHTLVLKDGAQIAAGAPLESERVMDNGVITAIYADLGATLNIVVEGTVTLGSAEKRVTGGIRGWGNVRITGTSGAVLQAYTQNVLYENGGINTGRVLSFSVGDIQAYQEEGKPLDLTIKAIGENPGDGITIGSESGIRNDSGTVPYYKWKTSEEADYWLCAERKIWNTYCVTPYLNIKSVSEEEAASAKIISNVMASPEASIQIYINNVLCTEYTREPDGDFDMYYFRTSVGDNVKVVSTIPDNYCYFNYCINGKEYRVNDFNKKKLEMSLTVVNDPYMNGFQVTIDSAKSLLPVKQYVVYPRDIAGYEGKTTLVVADNGREIIGTALPDAQQTIEGYTIVEYNIITGHTMTVTAETESDVMMFKGYDTYNEFGISGVKAKSVISKNKNISFSYVVPNNEITTQILAMDTCVPELYVNAPTSEAEHAHTYTAGECSCGKLQAGDDDTYTIDINYDDASQNVYKIYLKKINGSGYTDIKSATSSSKKTTVAVAEGVATVSLSDADATTGKAVTINLKDENDYTYKVNIIVRGTLTRINLANAKYDNKSNVYSSAVGVDQTVVYNLTSVPASADLSGLTIAGDYGDAITSAVLSANGKTLTVKTSVNPGKTAQLTIYKGSAETGVSTKLYITTNDNAITGLKPSASLAGTTDVSAELNLGLPKNFNIDSNTGAEAVLKYQYTVKLVSKGTEIESQALTKTEYVKYQNISANGLQVPLLFDGSDNAAAVGVFQGTTSFTASKYEITIKVVRVLPDYSKVISESKPVVIKNVSNKAPYYETKLSLGAINKTVYPGQSDIAVAIAKFNKSTTYRSLISALNVEFGSAYGPTVSPAGAGVSVKVDESNPTRILADISPSALPGKYTVTAYSECASGGLPVSAKLTFTVGSSISRAEITAPTTTIYKPDKKAVSVSFKAAAYGNDNKATKIKKTTWYLAKANPSGLSWIADAEKVTSLRNGKISIKNGKVSIAKDYVVSAVEANNKFFVCADLTGIDGTVTTEYSQVVGISADAISIAEIRIVDSTNHEITDLSQALTTDKLQGAKLVAYSTYVGVDNARNVPITEAITYKSSGKAIAIDSKTGEFTGFGKPGNTKLTASITDGGKSGKTLAIKTTYYVGDNLGLYKYVYADESMGDRFDPAQAIYPTGGTYELFFVGVGDNTEKIAVGENGAPEVNYSLKAATGKIVQISFSGAKAYLYQGTTENDTITLTNLATKKQIIYQVKNVINDTLGSEKLVKSSVSGYATQTVSIQLKNTVNANKYQRAWIETDMSACKTEAIMEAYEYIGTNINPETDEYYYSYNPATGVISGIPLFQGIKNGTYKFLLYMEKSDGKLTKPTAFSIKVVAAPKVTLAFKTTYNMKYEVGSFVAIDTTKAINLSENSLEYTGISNVNNKGSYSRFTNYFELGTQLVEGETKPVITLKPPVYPDGVTDAEKKQINMNYLASIAKMDCTGWVTYKYQDLAGIEVSGKIQITINLTQIQLESVAIDPSSIVINTAKETFVPNTTNQLNYTVKPSDATILSDPVWTSSDESIATVDANGLVTLKAEGTCSISVTIDGKKTGKCQVLIGNGIIDVTNRDTWPVANMYAGGSDVQDIIPNDNKDDGKGINDLIWRVVARADNEILVDNTWYAKGPATYKYFDGRDYTFYIPAGTYIMDVNVDDCPVHFTEYANFNIVIDPEAKLQATNNSLGVYNMFWFHNCRNIKISGGQLIGESKHTGSSGEYGIGLQFEGCRDMTVSNMDISNFWGDGIRVSDNGSRESDFRGYNDGISISGCNVHNNRRNNITITTCSNVVIENCTITNAGKSINGGTSPRFGVDIEPNYGTASDIKILGCRFSGNAAEDIGIIKSAKNITIKNCTGKAPRNDIGVSISQSGNSWQ